MQTAMEEYIYCASCGAANKKSAVTCTECEKKLNKCGSPFVDFLKDHIKDALQDSAKNNVFSLLKDFLLSHLYGTVLTLCVIATVCMSVYASLPPKGVTTVTLHPTIAAQQADAAGSGANEADTEAMWWAFYSIMDDYDHYALLQVSPDAEFEKGASRAYERLFAEHALPGYSYSATHDFLDGTFHLEGRALSGQYDGLIGSSYLDPKTLRCNAQAQSALAKQLYKDGYTVAEVDCYTYWASDAYAEEMDKGEIDEGEIVENAIQKTRYSFTFVEVDGTWYIANDIRL